MSKKAEHSEPFIPEFLNTDSCLTLRLESAKNKSDSLIPADEDMDNIKKLDEAKESRE